MKLLWIVLLLSIINISCACVKGSVDLTRNDKGEIMTVEYEAKNMMDFKISKDEVEVMTRKKPKPNFLDNVTRLAETGIANRVVNSQEGKD